MHDKTIRRRRAVLLALVVGSLLLLTASFGSSGGGGLGAIQGGVSTVLTPIQEGASRALKPVRDGVGWIGDTFDAKGQNAALRRERDALRNEKIDAEVFREQNAELRRMLDMNDALQIQDMGLVPARVISRAPNVINQTLKVNQGRGDGVKVGQPVVTGSGLAGTIASATSNSAVVTLLTDADFGAGAKLTSGRITGTVRPSAGKPRELRMDDTEATDDVRKDDRLVTSGTSDAKFPSPFPPNIPIGKVSRVEDPGSDSQVIHVQPYIDVRDVEFVEIITTYDPSRS